MAKGDLIHQLTEHYPQYSLHTAATMVQVVLASLAEALARGERIELWGFGSFALGQRKARERRNPRTGAVVFVPAMKLPFFKAAKEARRRVNRQGTVPQQESGAKKSA
ncbi:MAG TPA: HU family DNA-binding protein [Candidatus Binatia bacterium]|nr:HU family DNA-binding protein [Candidatus Binatia bacterium]